MLPHGSRNHTGDGHRVSSCSCDQPPLTGTPGPLHTLARGCTSFILLAQRGRAKAPWSVRDQGSKAIANSEVRPPGNVKQERETVKGQPGPRCHMVPAADSPQLLVPGPAGAARHSRVPTKPCPSAGASRVTCGLLARLRGRAVSTGPVPALSACASVVSRRAGPLP